MKISVCIPTYNQAHYLEAAIRSAASQSIEPYEIIVSNDCSTDNTKEVLDDLEQEISSLKVIHQPKNLGIAKNTDVCLRAAKGGFIIRLDSDDMLLPTYAERLIAELQKNPKAAYAHCAIQEIDQFNQPTKVRKLMRKKSFITGQDALRRSQKGYRVAANILLFRREALEAISYITTHINFAEDYYMTTSMAAKGYGNCYINEVLAKYRVWTDTEKVRQKRKLAEISGLTSVFEEVIIPAFKQKNWSLRSVKQKRAAFAIRHASCLEGDIYTPTEKTQVIEKLYQLSDSYSLRLAVFCYMNGIGRFYAIPGQLNAFFRQQLKQLLAS